MLVKFEGEKKKQFFYLAAAFTVAIVGLYTITMITSRNQKTYVKKELPQIKIVDDKKTEEESFKAAYGKRIGVLEEEIEDLKKQLQMTKEILKEFQNKNQNMDMFNKNYVDEVKQILKEKNNGPKIMTNPNSDIELPVMPQVKSKPQQNGQQAQKKVSIVVMGDLIGFEGDLSDTQEFEQNLENLPNKNLEKNNNQNQQKNKKTIENTIPAGSFVKAILLSGLDAPTSGSAIRNPHPVLFKLTDKAILPNRWKVNIRDCFVIGTGYGDLSSERAYIRLERLSCVKNDGNIISKTVEGYVSGEDGKNGLKGRVVSKQGQLLARTLLAGFLEGVSKAFSFSQQTLLINPQGAVQTVNPDQAFQYAGLSGISEATKKLADFYMNLVNKTFPVIEILPGRKVDIVFLKDVNLDKL